MAHPFEFRDYVILNAASKTALDLAYGAGANGTRVQGWEIDYPGNLANQRWRLRQDGDGWQIYNTKSETVLDVNNFDVSNGSKVTGWSVNGGLNQRWHFESVGEINSPFNRWAIKSAVGINAYLDLTGGSTWDSTQVRVWNYEYGTNASAQWSFLTVDL